SEHDRGGDDDLGDAPQRLFRRLRHTFSLLLEGLYTARAVGETRREVWKRVRLSGITWKPYVLSLPLTPTRLADGLGLGSALLHCTGGDAPHVAYRVRQSVPPYLPP